jgi:hypothetical protein
MESAAYKQLAGQLGFPGSERFLALLSYLLTREQAVVAAALPGTFNEVSVKTGYGEETVRITLEDLFTRGTIFLRGDRT